MIYHHIFLTVMVQIESRTYLFIWFIFHFFTRNQRQHKHLHFFPITTQWNKWGWNWLARGHQVFILQCRLNPSLPSMKCSILTLHLPGSLLCRKYSYWSSFTRNLNICKYNFYFRCGKDYKCHDIVVGHLLSDILFLTFQMYFQTLKEVPTRGKIVVQL